MCSMEILAPQEKKKPWFKRIFKLKKNKQKHHQKVPTTTQKRFRVKKSLEVAISEKSPQKAEEILFRFFDVLCPEDMRDLIIKSIIADESECISYPISYSSEYFSQTLLHTIMKCTKHSQFFDDKDWAPIHVAIKLKRAGATMYLLERQPSDINLPTKSDLRPPLHLAVFGGSDIMVRLLIEHGADFKSRDIYGNTALHVAVQTDADSIVELLLDESRKSHNQSIVNEGNNDGWTPLHLAAYRGNTSTCKILLQYGAYIDCQTKSGKTPLHWASIKSNKEVVTLLVEHSADLEATDRSERMPYQYATSKAIKRIIDVGESRRSSKSGSLRKVSIRIDPRSRNYWQVSKARDETNDCEKSVQSDITAMNSREKKSIHEINPRSALLINSFISSIDVLQLPHGMRSNLSEPDLSYKHQPLSPPISKLLKVPVSPVSSLSSFRSLGNSSKASEFYNQHGKKQPFSHGESGIFEQSIQDDESYCAVNKRSPSECQNTSYRSLPPATYEELTTLYRQIKFKAKRRLVPDVNPNFYINNRFLELYTTEAITCIKNPGTAWLSVCQKCSDENEEVMFFVGKMAAFFQDDHKDRLFLCLILTIY